MTNTVYLSLGSSQGDRIHYLQMAVEKIRHSAGNIISVSPVYETEPWGFSMEGRFLNMAIAIQTEMSPRNLLQNLLETERLMGRERNKKKEGYSSRIIDIDILFYNNLVINEAELNIPHPMTHLRNFVLTPLNDIAPELVHPVLKMTISELKKFSKDVCRVSLYNPIS